MPLPTLIPATHAPIWTAMIAWFTRAGIVFGCTATMTVAQLKHAFLNADRRERLEIYSALREVEYIVCRLMIAAALALRLDPEDAKPAAPQRIQPASNTVPDFDALRNNLDDDEENGGARTPGAPGEFAFGIPPTELIDEPDVWLAQGDLRGQIERMIDADAEDFARRYLSLARLLADPDAALHALARRFHADRRQAEIDVTAWSARTRGAITSASYWPDHFQAARAMIDDALQGFSIHVEPD